MDNSKLHPAAWEFYIEQARNISDTHLSGFGNYRIPMPDMSGEFIYANTVESLWVNFIHKWYTIESLNAPTLRGKIQFITHNF